MIENEKVALDILRVRQNVFLVISATVEAIPTSNLYHTLKTRYRQRCTGAHQKVGGPENLVRGPGNFIVLPPFNFYFNSWSERTLK